MYGIFNYISHKTNQMFNCSTTRSNDLQGGWAWQPWISKAAAAKGNLRGPPSMLLQQIRPYLGIVTLPKTDIAPENGWLGD